MLYTEPRVIANPQKLGFFDDYDQQELADLQYSGQQPQLQAGLSKLAERKTADTIPAPETPVSR